jgi:hypothetical protein
VTLLDSITAARKFRERKEADRLVLIRAAALGLQMLQLYWDCHV